MDADETESENYRETELVSKGDTIPVLLSSTKAGRKGDPRMHRAVSARLADPSISLFEALKVGGFDYSHDLDVNVVDSENVTLGQRKNQLSRRVRLARKQGQEFDDISEPDRLRKQQKRVKSAKTTNEAERSISKDDCLSDEDHMVDNDQDDRKSTGNSSREERKLLAKHHPQYQPIIIPQRVKNSDLDQGKLRSFRLDPDESFEERDLKRQRGVALKEAVHAEASAVAISSLTQTAARVGLTLEQLAVALQNCRTLTEILTSTSGFSQSRQDMAVALYQAENNALYQHAMVLGGYPVDVTAGQHPSPDYLQFVLACWQAEGKRLQTLVNQQQQEQISKCIADYIEKKS